MITRMSSGNINKETAWTACPAWLTEVQDTPGRITYPGGECQLVTGAAAQYAYLTLTDAFVKTSSLVIRLKMSMSNALYWAFAADLAARPSGAVSIDAGVLRFLLYGSAGPALNGTNDAYDAPFWTYSEDAGIVHVFEWDWNGGGNVTLRLRAAADLSQLATGNHAQDLTNNPFLCVGDCTAAHNGGYAVKYLHLFDSHDITVSGFENGNAARLYDSGDAVKASAVVTGGAATLDCTLVDWDGFSGYIKVFEDDTYAVEVDRYPSAGNDSDICGGDNYSAVTVTAITPVSGLNDGLVSITDLAGTGFVAGAAVALKKTGEVDIDATDVVVVDEWQITCDFDITDAEPGDWDVEVTNADATAGTLAAGFEVISADPVISTVTPSTAYVGDELTIAGSSFGATQGASTVAINATPVTEYVSWSDAQIVVTVPVGATSGNLVVSKA